MVIAAIQSRRYVKDLTTDRLYRQWDMSFIVACLTAIVGAIMFGSILFCAGSFVG